MPVTKSIFSVNLFTGRTEEFVEAILQKARARQSSYVCFANVHMVVEAHRSASFAHVVNSADLVAPDGMPLVKYLRHFYAAGQPRIDGMSLLPLLLQCCDKQGQSVFFYGGTASMLHRTGLLLQKKFPGLVVAGMHAPPFRPLCPREEDEVAAMIAASGASVVFVVLGCPKQEQWMNRMKGKIPSVMLGIGAALPVLIGMRKRAPQWMQRACLECLYRIAQEPARLLKRYAVTNTVFLWLLAGELFRRKKAKLKHLIYQD